MDTVHDSQAFIYHHLNMLERPSTPGRSKFIGKMIVWSFQLCQLWEGFLLLLVPVDTVLVSVKC